MFYMPLSKIQKVCPGARLVISTLAEEHAEGHIYRVRLLPKAKAAKRKLTQLLSPENPKTLSPKTQNSKPENPSPKPPTRPLPISNNRDLGRGPIFPGLQGEVT